MHTMYLLTMDKCAKIVIYFVVHISTNDDTVIYFFYSQYKKVRLNCDHIQYRMSRWLDKDAYISDVYIRPCYIYLISNTVYDI